MKAPKKINKVGKYLISCEWQDGFSSVIRLSDFRKECPCADCNKEESGHGGFGFQTLGTFNQGMNELTGIEKVGNYAIAASWGDGHDTGIYTWEKLREIFEKYALSDDKINEFNK